MSKPSWLPENLGNWLEDLPGLNRGEPEPGPADTTSAKSESKPQASAGDPGSGTTAGSAPTPANAVATSAADRLASEDAGGVHCSPAGSTAFEVSATPDKAVANVVQSAPDASVAREVNGPPAEAQLTHVEVGRMIFSFYCVAPDRQAAEARMTRLVQRLMELVQQATSVPQPEHGNFAAPRVDWLPWSLLAPQTNFDWCGACHLVFDAENLGEGHGCRWPLVEYKRFARWLDRLLMQALNETAAEFPSVRLDDKPFLWTLVLDTEPRVVWTEANLQRYQRSVTGLVRVRSEDWQIYTGRAMAEILRSNLAYTVEELQLLHFNTGLIYVARDRFCSRDGFDYVQRAVVDNNAIIRVLRACLLLFRSELDSRLHDWLQQRLRGRRLRRVLQQAIRHAGLASELLRQFDEQTFISTRQIGHQQTVFHALLQRYHIPELIAGLHQQLGELHHQIADLHNQVQSRQLRLINVLVLIPVIYQAWQLLERVWPTVRPFLESWLGNWF